MKRIRLTNLRKSFGKRRLLESLNLEASAGEFVAVLGPSGSGKSTLLKIIAGLEAPTQGRILIGEADVTDLPPQARDVAMVFQSLALYPRMSVRSNLAFALKVGRVAAGEIARRVERMAHLLRITDLLERHPGQLSGGEQQRVAIGRALVRESAILLLDEPLSGLDARLRGELRSELKRLHISNPRTTVYVTHDQAEAMALASRVAVLLDGRVQQCDRPEVLYDRPANTAVAAFLGSMKFLTGTLVNGAGVPALAVGEGVQLALPGLVVPSSVPHQPCVTVGIRPEHVQILENGAGRNGAVTATVACTEISGPDLYVSLALAGQELCARIPSGFRLENNELRTLHVNGAKVSVFRAADGLRLN